MSHKQDTQYILFSLYSMLRCRVLQGRSANDKNILSRLFQQIAGLRSITGVRGHLFFFLASSSCSTLKSCFRLSRYRRALPALVFSAGGLSDPGSPAEVTRSSVVSMIVSNGISLLGQEKSNRWSTLCFHANVKAPRRRELQVPHQNSERTVGDQCLQDINPIQAKSTSNKHLIRIY